MQNKTIKKLIVEFKKKRPITVAFYPIVSHLEKLLPMIQWQSFYSFENNTIPQNEGRKKPLLFCSFKVTALLIIYRQPERSWELVDENLNTEYWIWNFGYGTVERNRDQYITKNKWIIKLIKESKRRLKKDKLGAIARTPLVHSVLSSKLTYNFNQ